MAITILNADAEQQFSSFERGHELIALAAAGAPVPPAVAIAADRLEDLPEAVAALEAATGLGLDDPSAPLLLSVRTQLHALIGDRASLLDVGVTAGTLAGVAARLGDERLAHDVRRRFLERFGVVARGVDPAAFQGAVDAAVGLVGTDHLPADVLRHVCNRHEEIIEAAGGLPTASLERIEVAVRAMYAGVDAAHAKLAARSGAGTVILQAMAHDLPAGGSAIVGSRDARTGAAVDVPTGLAEVLRAGERSHRDAYEVDVVTSPSGELAVVGGGVMRRSGPAAVRIAHDLVDDPDIGLSRAEAVGRISAEHVEQILHPSFDDGDAPEPVAMGLGASPGAASGVVAFTADEAAMLAMGDEAVILVAQETSPEDMHGMEASAGILTTRGGLASHAAVVARGWGTPAVCGADGIQLGDAMMTVGGHVVRSGDRISIDGSSGAVYLGALETASLEPPAEFDVLLGWADDIRGDRMSVRANADTGEDAATARRFGAQGIGLCRTEHMFLAENRLPIMRQMILAETPAKEKMALTRLRLAQREDFVAILESMDGLPVTVRLLDPPLHEFLPGLEELAVAEARGELDADGTAMLAAAREWHEVNPMIGTRGVRLAWLKTGLYEMQVTALVEAVQQRLAAGGDPQVEIMIPLTVNGPELAGARGWVESVLAGADVEPGHITIGTMVETPRAALDAASLAEHADFFSFGTNDLTQLTFGFSRDDVEGRLMSRYLDQGLLDANPFEELDRSGVGRLVADAAAAGRGVRSDLKLGVCGEHGGDPSSIAHFVEVGLDYVSCSPYRVPVARLAIAQALTSAP